MSLGFTEILVILLFILLIFGAKRIPELARSLGRASYEYKKAKAELTKESSELLEVAENNAKAEDEKADAVAAEPEKTEKRS